MNTNPYFKIGADGTVNVQPPPKLQPGQDYSKKPVQVAIRREPLCLEIHGANFSTLIHLTKVDALGLMMMLAYALREEEYLPNVCEFVEVAK
jgi:hypothetical protein